jgi:hypothetical protein
VTIRLRHQTSNGSIDAQDDVDLVRRIAATVQFAPSSDLAPKED